MWEKTTTGLLGCTVKTEKSGLGGIEVAIAGNVYDAKGRLMKTCTLGIAATLNCSLVCYS